MTDTSHGGWELSDGVVTIRPPGLGDAERLIAGRDAEWERWLGPGDEEPHPTACAIVDGEVVGWVDYDTDQDWLKPQEVNVGYNIFAAHRQRGYATRAVNLLLRHVAESTESERAYLAIDAQNAGSLGVARAVGTDEVEQYQNDKGRPQIRHVVEIAPRRH